MKTRLRKLAQHHSCYLRISDQCRHDPQYTVLAHIRRGNIAGMGQKAVDVCGVPACDICHSIYDGRTHSANYTRAELDAEMLRALVQWLDFLWKNEIVIVV